MKILLADDHTLVREGLMLVLHRLGSDTVIVEAADCDAALHIATQHPDVELALLDIAMPGMDGLKGIGRLRERLPSTPIVMLSASEDSQVVREALHRGAQGFIPKSSTGIVMLSALRLIFSGGIYVPPSLLCSSTVSTSDTQSRDNTDDGLGLTGRQREVLALLVQGSPNKEIARALNISETTVRTHATAIFKLLHVTNRTQAGHVATNRGFCSVKK